MLNTFMFYLLYSSSIIIYGVGINRAVQISEKPSTLITSFLKVFISVIVSTLICFIANHYLLAKAGILELFPFTTVIIFLVISMLVELTFRNAFKNSSAEFAFSFTCVILALSESSTMIEAVLIASSCVLAFIVLVPILFAVRKRIEVSSPIQDFRNSSLLLISLAILSILTLVWNVSWLNKGVFH